MKFRFSEDFVIDTDQEPWKSEGVRIGFYSAPGTRKSYTVAACIVEPFLDEGGTVVIFEPRSEWHTLKQRYESVLVVGGPFQDVPLAVNHARVYAEAIVKHGASVVFDFSETEQKDLVRFAAELLARIFTLQNVVRRPLLLFIEEGSDYCPFSTKGKLVEPWIYARMTDRITKIATQGRPLGFMLTITSQRPAQLNFTVRMMCNLSFYGKFHPKDLTDVKEVLKSYDVPIKKTAEKCVSMPHGSWIAITSEGARYLSIEAKRNTPHGADTPKLEYEATRTEETKQTIDELTNTILAAMEKEKAEKSELEKAKRKIRELTKKLEVAEKKAEIKLSVREMLEAGVPESDLADRLAKAETERRSLRALVKDLKGELSDAKAKLEQADRNLEVFREFQDVLRKLVPIEQIVPSEVPEITLTQEVPRVTVKISKPIVELDEKTWQGRLVSLVAAGFFDTPRKLGDVQRELDRVFSMKGRPSTISRELAALCPLRILQRKQDSGSWSYSVFPGAKDRIKVKEVDD